MASVEREIKKYDPRYLLAPDIDPEFRESFINAPGHLKFPTRNHFAFLESVMEINPREEKIVAMKSGFEYYIFEAKKRFNFSGATRSGGMNVSERLLTAEEKHELVQAAKSLLKISGRRISFDEAYMSLLREVKKLDAQSLDKQIGLEGYSDLRHVDRIPDKDVVEDMTVSDMEDERLKEVCKSILTGREYRILESRLGLSGEAPKTLEEIGRGEGVTRERIRQIETKIFKKIRLDPRVRELGEGLTS